MQRLQKHRNTPTNRNNLLHRPNPIIIREIYCPHVPYTPEPARLERRQTSRRGWASDNIAEHSHHILKLASNRRAATPLCRKPGAALIQRIYKSPKSLFSVTYRPLGFSKLVAQRLAVPAWAQRASTWPHPNAQRIRTRCVSEGQLPERCLVRRRPYRSCRIATDHCTRLEVPRHHAASGTHAPTLHAHARTDERTGGNPTTVFNYNLLGDQIKR